MRSFIIKNAEPADNNICPYCKDENAQRLTPTGSHESLCFKCKKWFKAKLQDVVITEAENEYERMRQLSEVKEKMRLRYE
jgi:hypothetical protein